MEFAILSRGGLLFLFRWMHFLGGITWIGMLYYLNFSQGAFMAEVEPATKSAMTQKMFPRVFWWFRWGAMLTIISGLCYLGMSPMNYHSSWGVAILTGATMGVIMWANVWFVIWPAQKLNIQVATGGAPVPDLAARLARATVCSRTNVLFSIPMLFFMGAASHLGIQVAAEKSLTPLVIVMAVILGGLELNALKGKTGPLTTVKGVIHCGLALAVVLYVVVEVMTK